MRGEGAGGGPGRQPHANACPPPRKQQARCDRQGCSRDACRRAAGRAPAPAAMESESLPPSTATSSASIASRSATAASYIAAPSLSILAAYIQFTVAGREGRVRGVQGAG